MGTRPTRKTSQFAIWLSIFILVGLAMGSYWYWDRQHVTTPPDSMSASFIDTQLLASLDQQPNTDPEMVPTHLADDIIPPTNQWISGIVFGTAPHPIYPLPFAFKPSSTGFGLSVPTVSTTKDTIFGTYRPDITAELSGAQTYTVTRYDGVSADVTYYRDAKTPLARLTLSEGSPLVSYRALQEHTIELTTAAIPEPVTDAIYRISINGATYGLRLSGDATLSGTSLHVAKSSVITFVAKAEGTDLKTMLVDNPSDIRSVQTNYRNQASDSFTSIHYATTANKPTLFAALPHQKLIDAGNPIGYYTTMYGRMNLYRGTTFAWSVPLFNPSCELDMSRLSQADRTALVEQLRRDVDATDLIAADSYNGGKELYRAAQLYQLAKQLRQDGLATALQGKLITAFNTWFEPQGDKTRSQQYFYYDTLVKGLVAVEPAFGSENFNDHHFHYGYFLYAGAMLARYDNAFRQQHGDFLNLIASDIASPAKNRYFPIRRTFDAYMGHSWASGNGQFADGNNQESSSEAISAWNAVGLWARTAHNQALLDEATWMLSHEAASAQDYWLNIDTSSSVYAGYQHPLVALNWQGKRDFATFFSPEPTASLGIQLIPMPAIMAPIYRTDTNRITANLSRIPDAQSDTEQFSDYILMYEALASTDKTRLLKRAQDLRSSLIDGANSRSYLMAWILSQ